VKAQPARRNACDGDAFDTGRQAQRNAAPAWSDRDGISEMTRSLGAAALTDAAPAKPAPRAGASRSAAGVILAVATAALLAAQEPLTGPAAQKLGAIQFLLVTQTALAFASIFLLWRPEARRDFVKIISSRRGALRLIGLTLLGLCGLALYNLGLRHAHPVVISAILNLSPFWAALVARYFAGVIIPAGVASFATALAAAFAGAMLVAYSQMRPEDLSGKGLAQIFGQGSWYFAIPVPLFTALSGTLIGVWFKDYREPASIAAALLAPAIVLIPACSLYLLWRPNGFSLDWRAAGLLAAGAILAAGIGRLCYQLALSKTGGDNGFVTMFSLLGPGLAAVYSWLLSYWIAGLRFQANASYLIGLAVTAGALFYFLRKSRAG
jgi:drug/metabolite transporter (DMT)-like permease